MIASALTLPIQSFIVSICFLLLSANVASQADVRESSSASSKTSPPSSSLDPSIVYEIQALQHEVQELRGLLEKHSYELKRLKQQRLDDYLDLDKRVSELSKQPASQAKPSQPSSRLPSNKDGLPVATLPVLDDNSEQANELYNSAIDLLLNKRDYAGAEARFSKYLESYPKGKYVPNVYYWQGQILFAGAKKEEAAAIFEKLIAQYSAHNKVPDAKFKLAKIYFDKGETAKARAILDDLASGDTDVASLAKSFISKNY